jgi:predicted transcriptional regulator of viral defense system
MDDMIDSKPNHACLFGVASEQQGHFTAAQARACGFDTNLITYHKRRGRFIYVHRGVYRLRDYPSSPREDVVAAWLGVGRDLAVVSHESALDLLDLSDVIPRSISLTVPRSKRHFAKLDGVTVHTTTRQIDSLDVKDWEGIPITSAARTILDVAEDGTAPEQIEMAVRQAISRGLTTKRQLQLDATKRSRRVRNLVSGVLNRIA